MTVRFAGYHTTVEFDGRTCRLGYRVGGAEGWSRTSHARLVIPVTALAGVHVRPPGVLRPGRLTLEPRPGADPCAAIAGGPVDEDHSPYGIDFPPAEEDAAKILAERIEAAIKYGEHGGLASVAASDFLIEILPPLTARGSNGWAEFDGDRVTLHRLGTTDTLPLAAMESVVWVDGYGNWADYLRFRLVGDDAGEEWSPRHDARSLRHESAEEKTATLVLAAAVAVALERYRGAYGVTAPSAAGPPHGLQVGVGADRSVMRLHGVMGGSAEFDGSAVTVHTQGMTRRIPLPAIDHLELSDADGESGTAYMRVHLAGADPDASAFDPVLDVNAVCHASEPAALEFTLRVTEALRGVTRVPDPELLGTTGPRPDLADALARAGVRVRGMVPELAALPSVLDPQERVREVDLAINGAAGLLALTDRRLLFLAAGELRGDPLSIGLERIERVGARWNDDYVGRVSVFLADADEVVVFDGVHDPSRFRRLPERPEPAEDPEPAERPGRAERREPAEPKGSSIKVADAPTWFYPPSETRRHVGSPGDLQPRSGDAYAAPTGRGGPAQQDVERALLRAGRGAAPLAHQRVLRQDVREARDRAADRVRRHRRELDDILDELAEGEQVYELDAALMDGQDGLLVLTDRRLLFLVGDELLRIPAGAVRQVAAYDGLEELNIETNDRLRFRFFRLQGAGRFADAIDAEREAGEAPEPTEPADSPAGEPSEAEPDTRTDAQTDAQKNAETAAQTDAQADLDVEADDVSLDTQIQMLTALHRRGLLTERELQQKVARLLGRV